MSDSILNPKLSRRRFLQATGAAGAVGAVGLGISQGGLTTIAKAQAQPVAEKSAETAITKSFCGQCPARCGIDVYTTNGRVHAIFGTLDNPLSNGKLCPKGHFGQYLLYDPDRFKGPMKRTNPKKGRNEDPGWVPISWDEALNIVAGRLNALRDKGESHRYATMTGRGWGYTDVGLLQEFGKLYGTPNGDLGHSSICSDASETVKHFMDGHHSYSAYDYANTNYLLVFGAGFLESFRPFNANMQNWGKMRTKPAKTKVTVVDVHVGTTAAAADRMLLTKPGTDGALALAIAHVIMTEGLWDRDFVGDFLPVTQPADPAAPRLPDPKFETGKVVDINSFKEKWTVGVAEWWNLVLKDCTPEWAEKITTIPAKDIRAVALEFGSTKPAVALFERGASAHTNGVYNGMAIHALNALTGNMFAKGGIRGYQMKTAWAKLPINVDDYMDDYAKSPDRKKPRQDGAKSAKWPLVKNMRQESAINQLNGDPYKLDTVIFYMTGPVFSGPDCTKWEEAMRQMYVIDTSPYPGETAIFADLILPDNTYLERLQIADTYPYEGYPISMIRTPAIKPLYDTKSFGDVIIEVGKRIKGPTSEYYKKIGNTENIIKWMCEGFKDKPGDNGVNDFESFKAKGVWYRKPYVYLQKNGVFYEWDGKGYNKVLTQEEVKEKLLPTPTGKFEIKVSELEHHADYVNKHFGLSAELAPFPQWIEPKHPGGGDLHLISPKLAAQAEGRGANLPHVSAMIQPTQGGNRNVYLEIHPETAKKRGIADGDRVRIKNEVGQIEALVRVYNGIRPDTVALPMIHGHWAQGRWAKAPRMPSGSPNELVANVSEPLSGLACFHTGKVFVEKI
ncbi:molybdopterin-dependent oxidoreductase [Herbaspirillum sp. ST 5-3]|uniref:molybdopterin-dependent oxidoreductase n=1 Tax=Oxalobacteraceae TaxID=75682 RepID=UPI0010A3BC3A|nr:molybdopterin-dependent oxidoreductase [Herbaspirillum sp. ST 5-3]